MTSLKCSQCNFTNFATETNCKKCTAPLSQSNNQARRSVRPPAAIPEGAHICTACGILCKPTQLSRGTAWVDGIFFLLAVICFFVSWVLALMFLAISIGYMAWRMTGGARVCPSCEHPNPIPASSPVAQQFLTNLER